MDNQIGRKAHHWDFEYRWDRLRYDAYRVEEGCDAEPLIQWHFIASRPHPGCSFASIQVKTFQ